MLWTVYRVLIAANLFRVALPCSRRGHATQPISWRAVLHLMWTPYTSYFHRFHLKGIPNWHASNQMLFSSSLKSITIHCRVQIMSSSCLSYCNSLHCFYWNQTPNWRRSNQAPSLFAGRSNRSQFLVMFELSVHHVFVLQDTFIYFIWKELWIDMWGKDRRWRVERVDWREGCSGESRDSRFRRSVRGYPVVQAFLRRPESQWMREQPIPVVTIPLVRMRIRFHAQIFRWQ
jgi:hypothetical protein